MYLTGLTICNINSNKFYGNKASNTTLNFQNI